MCARYKRVLPGPNEYPGKIYTWTSEAEARLVELVHAGLGYVSIAKLINLEFPQFNKVTSSAVSGKVRRMRLAAKSIATRLAAQAPRPVVRRLVRGQVY
jgi:hypothetical protein